MKKIRAIGWDVDNVWYKGISTSHAADSSRLDPDPYVSSFLNYGWFSRQDIQRWADAEGKDPKEPIRTVADVAQMLTDFYYKIKKEGSEESLITREQIVQGKQALLKGMSLGEIKGIAHGIPKTNGLYKAIKTFDDTGLYQVAFSDGLFPFIAYLAGYMGVDHYDGVPCYVMIDNEKKLFEPIMLGRDDVSLVGEVEKFSKANAMFAHLKSKGYDLKDIAVIDDSGSNVQTLLRPVHEAGGIAIGFNPTKTHLGKFKEAGIPVLVQEERSLEPFIEIVKNPEAIEKYCI